MSRSPAADLAPLVKLLQAGVPPHRAAAELARVLALWAAELKDDDEQLQERLSGLVEQMTTGIEEMHEGIAEASDKGKPTLRRILATHEAVLDAVRKAQGAG
jgi:CHASE3 domain sensor protein